MASPSAATEAQTADRLICNPFLSPAVGTVGAPPPGNAPGVKDWTQGGTRSIKPEIRLTNGKQKLKDLSCTMEELIQGVIDSNKVDSPPSIFPLLCTIALCHISEGRVIAHSPFVPPAGCGFCQGKEDGSWVRLLLQGTWAGHAML